MAHNAEQLKSAIDAPILSICIATYNRCKFIGETLDSILSQLMPGVELLIVDGASSDDTQQVIEPYLLHNSNIRYFRETVNSGIDGDYDKAVIYAAGEFCWLMSDDDLLKPGAVKHIMSSLAQKIDLVVVNSEIWNGDFSEKLLDRRLPILEDVDYRIYGTEQFFVETANQLGFIGCVIIRRSVWLNRNRTSFHGTMFTHVGVIFQHPAIASACVIAEPLIRIRNGNASWAARTFEIWAIKWPQLIWSFTDFSETAKQKVCLREQWRKFKFLFYHRALGSYSLTEFDKLLSPKITGFARLKAYTAAIFPGTGANLIVVIYYVVFKRKARIELFDVLRSRYATTASHVLARTFCLRIKTVT
jgi:abequosyltransferase